MNIKIDQRSFTRASHAFALARREIKIIFQLLVLSLFAAVAVQATSVVCFQPKREQAVEQDNKSKGKQIFVSTFRCSKRIQSQAKRRVVQLIFQCHRKRS